MKIIKLIAAAVLLLSLLPASVYAYIETADGIVVEEVAETDEKGNPYLAVIGYLGYKRTVSVPSEVEGRTVKYISKSAFAGNGSVTKVILPDTVTEMGDEVFANCVNLRAVVLPAGLTRIGFSTFSGCTLLSEIILPEILTEIDDFAFEYCPMLKILRIPPSVSHIGFSVFLSCENLILDCTDNPYALQYALDNMIVTDISDSPDSPIRTVIIITAVLGAAVIAVNIAVKLIRRRKKAANPEI